MVGVVAARAGDLPGRCPGNPGLIDEEPHELGHGKRRVGIVELEDHLVRKQFPSLGVPAAKPTGDIPHSTSDEEVLLSETELPTRLDVVGRVEHPIECLDPCALGDSLDIVALRENVEIELGCRLGVPQPQDTDRVGLETCNQNVVGYAIHGPPVGPTRSVAAGIGPVPIDPSSETNRNPEIVSADLPGEATLEPGIGMLDLPTVFKGLTKHAVVVSQTVAIRRIVEGGQRIQKTGRQSAETTVAETRIGFLVQNGIQIESEQLHGFAGNPEQIR